MIPDIMYKIWIKTTKKLLELENLPDSKFLDVGLEAWDLIRVCANRLNPNYKATIAFWLSWNDGNRKRKEIVEFINREQTNEKVTVDNVRDYLNNARSNILKCLKTEYDIEIKL